MAELVLVRPNAREISQRYFRPGRFRSEHRIMLRAYRHRAVQRQLGANYSSGSITATAAALIWILLPGKSILMTRGFGEHITRVSVAGRQQTYDVASLRQTILGHRRDLWLYFSRHRISVITDDEKRALEHAQRRPNQTSNQPLAALAPVRGGSALSR